MTDETNKTLPSAFDEKAITVADIKPNLPLAVAYNTGVLKDYQSYGGRSLVENMERVDKAIEKSYELGKIYGRNHSEWTRRHINLDNYDPWFNLRQVSAELSSRRNALQEAKWRHVDNQIKMKDYKTKLELAEEELVELQRELSNASVTDSGFVNQSTRTPRQIKVDINRVETRMLKYQAEIAQIDEGLMQGMSHIEGAMKECEILSDLYDQIKQQLHDFNEADWERHQARAHLREAIAQSMRDVRQYGIITKGEQELLEQIGVNPGTIQKHLQEFAAAERESDNASVAELKAFIENLAEELLPLADEKSRMFGFSPTPKTDYMSLERIGRLEDTNSETSE